MSRGGKSGAHVSYVVGPPLGRKSVLFLVVAEGRWRGQGGILNFHDTLPVAIGLVLDGVRSDEGSRRAVNDRRACIVPVEVRDFCEVPVVVRL